MATGSPESGSESRPFVTAAAISMPDWLVTGAANYRGTYLTHEDRMAVAIDVARRNVAQSTGGPFGAAIFEEASGVLVSVGVNLVIGQTAAFAHAEMLAFLMAGRAVESFDLGSEHLPAMQLVTSCEPCAMCLGTIPWSGVRSVICGARDSDIRNIGFDEGSKPQDWIADLNGRGIAVTMDVLRVESVKVLEAYAAAGAVIYNGRSTQS